MSLYKIVEFHPTRRVPSDMSQVDSEISKYPFYSKIKSQVMNLNFETTSDWSDEARFLDEVRDVGLKDEGRLTYHEMLIAYRRSQARVHITKYPKILLVFSLSILYTLYELK